MEGRLNKLYDVAIVGAGPAVIFCADVLITKNKDLEHYSHFAGFNKYRMETHEEKIDITRILFLVVNLFFINENNSFAIGD